MDVSVVLTLINHAMNDAGNTVAAEAIKIAAIDEAVKAVIGLKPESGAVTGTITLAAGTKQSLATATDANAVRLLGIHYNVAFGGTPPGRAVKETTLARLSANDNSWATETAASAIREYAYDPDQDPDVFYVVPPLSSTGYANATYSQIPDTLTADDDTFPLADTYLMATVEMALYRIYTRDDVGTDNYQRGQGHYAKALELLGIRQVVEDKSKDELRQL